MVNVEIISIDHNELENVDDINQDLSESHDWGNICQVIKEPNCMG